MILVAILTISSGVKQEFILSPKRSPESGLESGLIQLLSHVKFPFISEESLFPKLLSSVSLLV